MRRDSGDTQDDESEARPARKPRGAPRSDPDLEWLFCASEGLISGVGSSHGALVGRAQTGARMGPGTRGIPRSVGGITATQAEAVEREGPLLPRLRSLSHAHQRMLLAIYGPRLAWVVSLSHDAAERLGPRAALLPHTAAAARGWAAEAARRALAAEKGGALKRQRRRAEVAEWWAKGLLHWLTGPAIDADALREILEEAEGLAAEAWQAWQATRPPRTRRRAPPEWSNEIDGALRQARKGRRRDEEDDEQDDGARESGEYATAAPTREHQWRREREAS